MNIKKIQEILRNYMNNITTDDIIINANIELEEMIDDAIKKQEEEIDELKLRTNKMVANYNNNKNEDVSEVADNILRIADKCKNKYYDVNDENTIPLLKVILKMRNVACLKAKYGDKQLNNIYEKIKYAERYLSNKYTCMLIDEHESLKKNLVDNVGKDFLFIVKDRIESELYNKVNNLCINNSSENNKFEFKKIFNYKDMQKLAEEKGFRILSNRGKGGHFVYKHKDNGRITVIPAHELGYGLSYAIQKQINENVA